MALLEVLKFPDPRLRQKAQPVLSLTPELSTLAQNMLETMKSESGVGLATVQVGQTVRLIVVDTRMGTRTRSRKLSLQLFKVKTKLSAKHQTAFSFV